LFKKKNENRKASSLLRIHAPAMFGLLPIKSTALVYKNTSTFISVNPLLGIGQVSTVLTASRAAQVAQTTHDP